MDFNIKHNEWRKILESAQGEIVLEVPETVSKIGPKFGRYDLYAGVESYMFCMFLPGADAKQDSFSCEVMKTGIVTIKGVLATESSFEASSRFVVTFQLPEPVIPEKPSVWFSGFWNLWGIIHTGGDLLMIV